MYLTGCQNVEDLASRPLILTGELVEALKSLDIDYKLIGRGG